VLHGVVVTESFEVAEGVRLVPLSEVPPTSQLERMLDSLGTGTSSFMGWHPPTAALVSRRSISPYIITSAEQLPAATDAGNLEYMRLHNLHADVARVLCLAGPALPLIVEWWFVFDDADLHIASSMDHRRSWPLIEISPAPGTGPSLVDPVRASELATAYLNLAGGTKAILDRALDRLRQAQARRFAGDAAVEIFTALEALLGDGETSELSHKMSTRAVRLLGGTAGQRAETFSALKRFYGVRSKIMHTGTVDAKKPFRLSPTAVLSLDELSARCIKICGSVLTRIIRLGHIPKWTEFDVTENPLDGQ
jgi:hypothetical protein